MLEKRFSRELLDPPNFSSGGGPMEIRLLESSSLPIFPKSVGYTAIQMIL